MTKKLSGDSLRKGLLIALAAVVLGFLIVKSISFENLKRSLIAQGIYELNFSYIYTMKCTETYYMICEPPEGETDVKTLVDEFIDRNNLLPLMNERSSDLVADLNSDDAGDLKLESFRLCFISPTREIPIGVYPDDIYESKYNVGASILVTVWVTPTDMGFTKEYFWGEAIGLFEDKASTPKT